MQFFKYGLTTYPKVGNFLFHWIRLSILVNFDLGLGGEVKIHEKEWDGDTLT